jgi:hypothetical protein
MGRMVVRSPAGTCLVPTQQGIWILAGIAHGITTPCRVATRNVYLNLQAAEAWTQTMPSGESSPMRQLVDEAVDPPVDPVD